MRIGCFELLTMMAISGVTFTLGTQEVVGLRHAGTKAQQAQTPFTAEFKASTVRTLANGTTITRDRTEVQAVDSRGRRMTASTEIDPSGEERTTTTVFDPAAGTRTSWDSLSRQVFVNSIRKTALSKAICGGTDLPQAAQRRISRIEDMGVKTIDGVEARGLKTTYITPAGMVGNSEPLTSIRESWKATAVSPFRLVVQETSDDPQSGKTTKEMTSVNLSEPDASVFQPPQGYEVVNSGTTPAPCPAGEKAAPVAEPQN